MQGEPTIMYQKPQEKRRDEAPKNDNKPWFNKRSENGQNRGGKSRDRSFGDRSRASKSHAPREEGGNRRPEGDRPWSNHGDAPKRSFAENRAEVRGERSDGPQGERRDFKPRGERSERRDFQPRGERHGDVRSGEARSEHRGPSEARKEFKPRSHGMKGERAEGGPRKSFGFKGKPSGNAGGGKKFGGGRPGGFGSPKRNPA